MNDPREAVLQFNECINNRDLEGLSELMTENHRFIDSENSTESGKERMVGVWKGFFEQFPDYRNHFSTVEFKDGRVVITGRSTCSFEPLDGPAIWTALVKEELVEEWRVYYDTPENRIHLGLDVE